MGQLSDNSDRIEVVEESALPLTKEKFQKIYSEHIYSLQKSLANLQLLALIELPNTQFSSINCKESTLKLNHLNSKPVTKLVEQTKKSFESEKKVESNSHSKKVEQEICEKTDTNEKKEKVNKTPIVKEKSKKATVVAKKPVQSREAGFRNMFAKVADVNSKRLATQKEEAEKNVSLIDDDSDEEETEKEKERKEKSTSNTKKEKIKETKNTQQSTKKDSKRKMENKELNNIKKRRRIIAESDSSEEENELNNFEEEIKENTISHENKEESPKITKSPIANSPEINDRSEKRVVHEKEDVRYVDDDGFLVTKKVNVTKVTTKVAKERSPSPKKSKQVTVNKKQTKQSTLTSFFKKK